MQDGHSISEGAATQPPRLLIDRQRGVVRVSFPRGHADGIAVRELYETSAAMTDERNPLLLVDLSNLASASSGLLGILVSIKKKFLHVGGQLHIAVPNRQIFQQFELMNLHLVLKLFEDIDTADKSFKR